MFGFRVYWMYTFWCDLIRLHIELLSSYLHPVADSFSCSSPRALFCLFFFFFIIRFSFCLHTVPCYCCCYYCRISLFIRHIIEILYTHTKMKSSKHSLQTGDECVCVHCVFMHTNIRSTFTSINNNILNYTYWKLYLTATSTSLSSLFITLKKTKRQRREDES